MESLLTETWRTFGRVARRSTIGGYLLGTLDEPWQKYIDFHLNVLGCAFCKANLEDLRQQSQQDNASLRRKIMQSTVGFFR